MRTHLSAFLLCVVAVAVGAAQPIRFFRLIGQWGDLQLTGLAVKGDYAYAVGGRADTCRLFVISVADPSHPVEVGRSGILAEVAWDIAVSGDYAFVPSDTAGLRVISVSDPTHPTEVGRCPGIARYVTVSGEHAYVTDDDGLTIISITDPAHPIVVGHCRNTSGPYDWQRVQVSGEYAYVAAWLGGLRVVSIADPTNPVEVGSYEADSAIVGVALGDGYAYLGCLGSFRVLSIADPTHPVEVGAFDSTAFQGWGIALIRGYALVAGGASAGLWAISISDPTRPILRGYYRGSFGWHSLTVNGDYVYYAQLGLAIYQFYQLGDLDIDNDSLDIAADTLRLSDWDVAPGDSLVRASGDFVLANTNTSYNPDSVDGPSVSVVDSLNVTGSLKGSYGAVDSIVIRNLPSSLVEGQTFVCTLTAYVPVGLRDGDYAGSIYTSGKDTADLEVYESCYVRLSKLGDIDIDNDSLDVVADTIRARPRLVAAGPPATYSDFALGEFVLTNTSSLYNPDTLDGPSSSTVNSLRYSAALAGPRGTIDSVDIRHFPDSLRPGQAVVCTLAAYLTPGLPDGDYSGQIIITRSSPLEPLLAETVYARVTKLGDLDIDGNARDVVRDTLDLRTQPAGPVYHPYAKAGFVLVSTSSSCNPDTTDGPGGSPLFGVKVEARIEARGRVLDSVYVLNLPQSLGAGEMLGCTLAVALPKAVASGDYGGWVAVSATDTLGYAVRDSFFLVVRGPEPRQNIDSLRVAPVPFKPNQNPEHDAIHFQGLTSGARVTVYDASGQSVWSATENGDGHLAWKAEVASGVYVYLVVALDGASKVGKLSVIR